MNADTAAPFRTPCSTYRLQFHRDFTFRDAERIVPYLDDLGVSDCYCSPYVMARARSRHGYDIIDHTRLNPELGDEVQYAAFVGALHRHGLGQILDFVPNHMSVDPRTNRWWHDVLENGPWSLYARYFDIDWTPVKAELNGKVLLPILGDQYGSVLERGELRLGFAGGTLHLDYFQQRLPINPRKAVQVYAHGLETLGEGPTDEDPDLREFLSILTQLRNLPDCRETDPDRIAERHREKEVARQRLSELAARSPRIARHVDAVVRTFNGEPGRPESFDLLDDLLEQQAYRLAYWRTAAHEINYRRFFDINDLAGLRMEDPEVFAATHSLVARLIADGAVSGVRIDHPDGLYDPAGYFRRVQAMAAGARAPIRGERDPADEAGWRDSERPLYLVTEKILSAGESLPAGWAIHGTTGYNYANVLNGIFVDGANARALRRVYRRVTHQMVGFDEVAYQCKKLITRTSLASELNVLAHALNQISEGNRRSRDFTLNSLRDILGEVVACFPVYRTYVSMSGWTQSDRQVIETAVRRARRRNPALETSAWDFLREVLLPRAPGQANEENHEEGDAGGVERRVSYLPPGEAEYRERLHFAMRFQQYTAPVQAKGVEDTAFYRYNLLLSLNEVGGEPGRFGRSAAEFHEGNRARLEQWPLEMTTTATHDAKLGEDVRARINVVSELADDWRRALARWMRINAVNRTKVDSDPAPDRNDEYRFYQVLVGTWPAEAFTPGPTRSVGAALAAAPGLAPVETARPDASYVQRVRDYMIKAIKEAKVRTSWINDNKVYDEAMAHFVDRTLTGPTSARFLAAFFPLARRVASVGVVNSLAQLALKIASPGVPDFYQGNELWDLHLVDPDNRQEVDYEHRVALLDEIAPWLDTIVSRDGRRFGLTERPGHILPGPATAESPARRPDGLGLDRFMGELLASWPDGRIKLFLTAVGLRLRRALPDLFLRGDYIALEPATGAVKGNALAFARRRDGHTLVVAVPRLVATLVNLEMPVGDVWGEARLPVPDDLGGTYRNLLTGQIVTAASVDGGAALKLADAFRHCPVALLWRQNSSE